MGSEINWGTVERLDGPLSETDTEHSEQLLDVPELTDDALQAMDDQHDDTMSSEVRNEETTQRGEPGSQVACEVCGKTVRVRRDGELSKHKCEPKAQRGNRFDHLPDRRSATPRKVRDFGITVLAWTVEEGSAHVLARPFDADPDDVPTELPDAEGMIGPPLDLLWPNIPDSAQKFIAACADNSDLIACALAWGDWIRTLGKWTNDMRKYQQSLSSQENISGATQSAAANGGPRLVPFSPA